MSFTGPNIIKGSGLNRSAANKDRVVLLMCGGIATAELALDTPVQLLDLATAESYGIDAAYDAANSIRVYDHIKEAFRLAPDAEIILNLAARPDATEDWFGTDKEIEMALRKPVCSDVKNVFVAWNFEAAYTPTYTANGLDAVVLADIPKAQALVTRLFNEKRYLENIFLDAFSFDALATLQDLRTLNSPNVLVNIALDGTQAALKDTGASMGALIGMWCVRNINESLGSVELVSPPSAFKAQENYPLDNGIRFTSALLVDGTAVATLSMAVQSSLTEKGYIFPGSFADYPGVYFNADPTCSSLENDFAYAHHNSIWCKAAREVRIAMIPKIRSILKLDPDTGYLRATTAEALAQRGQIPLDAMLAADLVSAAKITIDPEQTPNDSTPLVAKLQVQKDGILYEMDIDISLVNEINI